MKYGLLKFTSDKINLGDYMQLEAIRQAYKKMGIAKEDIVEIERDLLGQYDGEYVILPLAGAFIRVRGTKMFPLSPKIIPVFVGFFTADETIVQQLIQYKHFGPFGCRDLVTMNLLRQHGLCAYVSGCCSIGFEKRKEEPKDGKVIIYNPPEKLMDYIPEELLKEAVYLNNPHKPMDKAGYCDENEYVAKGEYARILELLVNEAKLVITRRLHVALPCVAMGIPVVLAHECDTGVVEECRFAGLDRILKVYKPLEYSEIDWNPKCPDIEELKQLTIENIIQMIKEAHKKWSALCTLSDYYEATDKQIYYSGIKAGYISEYGKQEFYSRRNLEYFDRTLFEYIVKKKLEKMHLIFYGAGDKGQWALRRYQTYIERAKKFTLMDGDPKKWGKTLEEINGKIEYDLNLPPNYVIQSPEVLLKENKESVVLIVCADKYYQGAGAAIGNMLMDKPYYMQEGKNLFFLDKMNNSLEMSLSETSKPFYFIHGF